MRNRSTACIAFVMGIFISACSAAQADTAWAALRSVEWLVDTSEVIFVGSPVDAQVEVLALLKSTRRGLSTHSVGRRVEVSEISVEKRLSFRAYDDMYFAGVPQANGRAIYFLRISSDGGLHLTKKIRLDTPIMIELDHKERLAFYGVDRHGQPILNATEVLQLVRQRIQHGPVIPLTLNRELAEVPHKLRPLDRDRFGARWAYSDDLSKGDWAFEVCVPDYQQY